MSFLFDNPRNAPLPTCVEKAVLRPIVPEVSMICPNKPLTPLESYKDYQQHNQKFQQTALSESNTMKNNFYMEKNGFQKIYMANIPNSRLDLSLIESKKENIPQPSENNVFEKKQETNTKVVEQSFMAFGSYKEFKKKRPQNQNTTKKVSFLTQPNEQQLQRHSDEPTVRDLLKIIQQQNEQLLLLQKQVACLIENRSQPPINVKQIESEEFLPPKVPNRFAIDVMTSFEVSIRPQQQQQKTLRELLQKDNEVKIKEITETPEMNVDKDVCNDDLKLSTLSIREECPSPQHSVHVDMQDYSSDSSSEDEAEAPVNWTVYENVMAQVNNILKKAEKEFKGKSAKDEVMKSKTLRKVKESTMKHLNDIGFHLQQTSDTETSDTARTTSTDDYTPTELSFAVKQLFMKYLPDDYLTKAVKNANCEPINRFLNDKEQPNGELPKILDITTLKQRPKLL